MELELLEPPITCYLHHSYPLTVAMFHKDFDSWFFSNYIQLEYKVENDTLNFFTYPLCGSTVFCPLIDYRILDLEFIFKANMNVIDFIKNSINQGYYVITYVDEFFIPERIVYLEKMHLRHEIMIYGFDINKSIFNVIGYTDKGAYAPSCVSFSEFKNSFLSSINKANDIMLLKAKDKTSFNPSYEFDIESVKNLLSEYLLSKNSSANLRPFGNPYDYVYGISVYKQLIMYYQNVLQSKNEENCDIRHFHLLYEHKKTMVSRLEYLTEKKYINTKNDFISIFMNFKKDALKLRNSLIKYNISKDKMLLNTVIDTLQKMYKGEKETIEELLNHLLSL